VKPATEEIAAARASTTLEKNGMIEPVINLKTELRVRE
jgi:hypothetical protein